MIVDIEKVIVKDRIRKDFGDIQELANDIKDNGLINPPVVNKNYELLAGERRLRACKALGWKQIEVRMMDTRDAEHELNVEISENDVRKGFTKSERVDYMKRLLRIEQAKAKERMRDSGGNISTPVGKSRDITAEQFGISGKTMEKEMSIVDNKDLLEPTDFVDWDEGKLSTNKAFQKIKERQQEAVEENERLRKIINTIDAENIKLKMQKKEKKEVIKKVEVVPDDYEELKRSREASKKEYASLRKEYDRMADKWKQAEHEKDAILKTINAPEEKRKTDLKSDCFFFCRGVKNFLEKYGGYIYLKDELDLLPDREQKAYMDSIRAMRTWVDTMLDEITIGG